VIRSLYVYIRMYADMYVYVRMYIFIHVYYICIGSHW